MGWVSLVPYEMKDLISNKKQHLEAHLKALNMCISVRIDSKLQNTNTIQIKLLHSKVGKEKGAETIATY